MNKNLIIALLCLILSGCGWKDNFQVSDINMDTFEGITYFSSTLRGSIKKIKNVDCDTVYIKIKLKSGNLVEEESIPVYHIDEMNVGEIKEFEYIFSKSYKGYSILIQDVICN